MIYNILLNVITFYRILIYFLNLKLIKFCAIFLKMC